MSIEFGLFNDEGLVEGGFYSFEEAQDAWTKHYPEDEDFDILEVCPEHPEYPDCMCEECDLEDRDEDEEEEDEEYD